MQLFNIEWKWNVPNALSVLRIVLIPCFAVLYLLHLDGWAFGVLLLSGLTDCFDGYLARRLNQITDCGKLLDPLSDKLTQVVVVVCLTTRYPELLPLTVLCFVKELCQGIGGVILLRKNAAVRGSMWFGKVSTIVFYVCMLCIVLWHDIMSVHLFWLLVVLAGLCTLLAFIGYVYLFIKICRAEKLVNDPAADPEKGTAL
ncbi:MAG: CDP-alcohol phosphatidyltransferase family protein [Clostridia bacterium]|nr:CDP-alcohol phosphatidyltransferase family protein [Clostridia bacterium]